MAEAGRVIKQQKFAAEGAQRSSQKQHNVKWKESDPILGDN